MRTLHAHWAWVAVAVSGAVGLWGLGAAALRRRPGRAFDAGVWAAVGSLLVQAALGFAVYGEGLRPGDRHLFYGFLVLFTLAGAYIFRARIARRPAPAWGVLLLFSMGLAIRAWATVAG
ncbi:MAG: hypothetical protein KQH83_03825 [Actinobacteria bacterium]|nr:hypothetical protein [Actinomycetota bacterium]